MRKILLFTPSDISALIEELKVQGNFSNTQESVRKILSWNPGDILIIDGKEVTTELFSAPWKKRFETVNPMYYRDYLSVHQVRVSHLVHMGKFIIEEIYGRDVLDTAYYEARFHDVGELLSVFGDIATHYKRNLSPKSRELLKYVERKSMEILLYESPIPPDLGYTLWSKEDLQGQVERVFDEDNIVTQIVSYFDKLDGCMVALHEVIAGNKAFIGPLKNYLKILQDISEGKEYSKLQPLFDYDTGAYEKMIGEYAKENGRGIYRHFHGAISLFDRNIFGEIESVIDSFISNPKRHNTTTLRKDFGIAPYGVWKTMILGPLMLGEELEMDRKRYTPVGMLIERRV